MRIGGLEPGAANAITDVPGVRVGHVTVWRDEPEGRGIARTGVTAILPGPPDGLFREPVPAGAAVLNGAGELTGSVSVARVGDARDAGLPDVDDGGRPGLRRRGRPRRSPPIRRSAPRTS